MLPDRYELSLSTGIASARDDYVAGVDCLLAGNAGVEDYLMRATAADPGFALARAALARGHFVKAEVAAAREAMKRARELAPRTTPREQSHVNALGLAIEGNPVGALEATRAHLAAWPRDAMVLAPVTGVFGLIGFSGRPEREAELYELLRELAPHYGEDWWFDLVFAFAACESGKLDEAWRLIGRSMAAFPGSGHGAHIKSHVLYEMGEARAGLQYLEEWLPGFDRLGLMHCHLSWHLALFFLLLGKTERAWEVYRQGVHPGGSWGPSLNVATDTASFLWRSELAGEARRPELWREVKGYALEKFPKAGVFFADVHVALAFIADGDGAALEKLLGELRGRLAAGKLPPGEVVPRLAQGFAAYACADWAGAISMLEGALRDTVRIGGSRAQRDLVELTLLAAYLKADRPESARALLARRVDRRPPVSVAGIDAFRGAPR